MISAVAVTIPSCYFLWPSASHADAHGAHGDHEEHEDEHEEAEEPKEEDAPAEEDEPKEEESKSEEAAPKDEESKEEESKDDGEKSEDKDSEESASKEDKDTSMKQPQSNAPKEGESKSKTTSDGENMPENKGNIEGVQFKGKSSAGDEDNEIPDVRKREPDSKGAFKKRIDSAYGKNLGEGPEKDDEGNEEVRFESYTRDSESILTPTVLFRKTNLQRGRSDQQQAKGTFQHPYPSLYRHWAGPREIQEGRRIP